MTYDQLAAFAAVVSSGSFARASKVLHKSQPAVSKLVQNLEQELGITLLDRSAYRPLLTSEGQLFHERALAVLEETEALRGFANTLGGELESTIRLVVEAVTPLAAVLAALREVQKRFPPVRLELRTERLGGALEALEDGSADLVITGSHGMRSIRARTTEVARYGTVRILPLAARTHPLALVRKPLPPRLLRAHAQVILRESGKGELTHSVNVLEGGLRWTVTDIEAKKAVLLSGMGWGGLPEHLVTEELRDGRLVELRVPFFSVETIELFLLRRRDRAVGLVARSLWDGLLSETEAGHAGRPKKEKRRARGK